MTKQWLEFLATQGASILKDEAQFGNPESEVRYASENTVVCSLSHLTFINVTGNDATTFLQSQLTNDVAALGIGGSQINAYCTAKGRALAILRAIKTESGYLLLVPKSLGEPLRKKLGMYVLRAKVALTTDTDSVLMGVSGPKVGTLLQDAGLSIPGENNNVTTGKDVITLRSDSLCERYMIITSVEKACDLWSSLSQKARPCSSTAWRWLDIVAGIPSIYENTTEKFVPQMANLDLVDGISFKKGCYPGQEIVARTKYLGKLKQRMVMAHAGTSAAPAPGDSVYCPDFGDQSAGTVVDATPAPNGGCDILVVAQIKCILEGELHLGSKEGPSIDVRMPPYQIPELSPAQELKT